MSRDPPAEGVSGDSWCEHGGNAGERDSVEVQHDSRTGAAADRGRGEGADAYTSRRRAHARPLSRDASPWRGGRRVFAPRVVAHARAQPRDDDAQPRSFDRRRGEGAREGSPRARPRGARAIAALSPHSGNDDTGPGLSAGPGSCNGRLKEWVHRCLRARTERCCSRWGASRCRRQRRCAWRSR